MKNSVRIIILTTAKYTPTQLGLTVSLSPKTKRDAPRTEVNTKTENKKKFNCYVREQRRTSAGRKENNTIMPRVRLYSAGVAWNFRCGI